MATKSVPENTNAITAAPAARRFTLWHLSLVLVVIGLLISGYLSYSTATKTAVVCAENAGFSCDTVQSSAYSKLAGIPIAYLGFLSYVVIGGLILFQPRIPLLQQYGLMLTFGLVLFGWLYSMYLVYLQARVLEAFCQWCLMHELTFTVLFVVTLLRLRNELFSPAAE